MTFIWEALGILLVGCLLTDFKVGTIEMLHMIQPLSYGSEGWRGCLISKTQGISGY
jgi:hypothetical protein